MMRGSAGVCTALALVAACGDNSAGTASASGSSSSGTSATTMPSTSGTTESPTSGATTSGNSGSQTDSTGAPPTTGTTGTGTTGESGTTSTTDSTTGSTTGTTDAIKLDVGAVPDGGAIDECGCGKLPFSYIWIANAEQGTVSKIDTLTLTEVGRYITRPDGMGNPSRTSVSFYGDVVVANRHGGLTKIWARESDCQEKNGVPGIQTSTGAADILPWGQDECVAWYTAFPTTTNQRPVAWAQGVLNPDACAFEGAKVWTVTSTVASFPGVGGFGGVTAYLVNGDTGAVESTIQIDDFQGAQLGAYGGAVDQVGDLWFVPMGAVALPPKYLAHVSYATLTYELIPLPAMLNTYGIAVDTKGRVWVSSTLGAGAGRFDPVSKTWDIVPTAFTSIGGLAQGADGTIWVSSSAPQGAMGFHPDTLAKTGEVTIPGQASVKGVAIDRDERLWLISETTAYKFDQALMNYESYNGLTGPYTYSDMTGFGLFNTVCTAPQ